MAPDDVTAKRMDAERALARTFAAIRATEPDPLPDDLFERICRRLDRMDKRDRRRARMRLKKRRGW
jgi:hypothetical protein